MSRYSPLEPATASEGSGVFGKVGRTVVKRPLVVIAFWIVLAAGLTQIFPSLAVLAQKALLHPAANAPSVVSQKQMADDFKEASSDNILLVVLTNENGLTAADENVYKNLIARLRAEPEDVAALQDFISVPPLKRYWPARTVRPGCCRSTSSAKLPPPRPSKPPSAPCRQ